MGGWGEKTVTLAAGKYLFAVGHREGNGGSGIDINLRADVIGITAQETIKPTATSQNGLWSVVYTPRNSLTKSGSGTATLTGDNTYSGGTTVAGGTLLVNNASGSGTGPGR